MNKDITISLSEYEKSGCVNCSNSNCYRPEIQVDKKINNKGNNNSGVFVLEELLKLCSVDGVITEDKLRNIFK